MSRRVPLWVDLSEAPASERDAIERAAEDVAADAIVDGVDAIIIEGPEDQQRAMDEEGVVIVDGRDWSVIPLENLIAGRRNQPGTLFALARTPEEAKRFCNVLDIGVHGIVLAAQSPDDVWATAEVLAGPPRPDDGIDDDARIQLTTATVESIDDAGMAERVCIDCTERFQDGEGMLVGSTADSFALIHAETIQTDFVNARPFRVNAGAVHSYALGPNFATNYLSELHGGHEALAVNVDGEIRRMQIGRVKIEHRPHSRVSWSHGSGFGNAVVQHAETIRFVTPDGEPVAVTELKPGDQILVHAAGQARHVGLAVKERLIER